MHIFSQHMPNVFFKYLSLLYFDRRSWLLDEPFNAEDTSSDSDADADDADADDADADNDWPDIGEKNLLKNELGWRLTTERSRY